MIRRPEVHVIRGLKGTYPALFDPPRQYLEYPFSKLAEDNRVYEAIRNLFAIMGLDRANFNTAYWNPLGEIISPGQRVVIKPNFVMDFNPIEEDTWSLITHGSIVRAMVDYCYIALQGKGQIVVCDAPLQSAEFGPIRRYAQLDELAGFYKKEANFNVEIVDLRKVICSKDDPTKKCFQDGDPNGYTMIDLGGTSCHADRHVDYGKYRVTDYDPALMRRYHNRRNHAYLISNTVLSADVVINLPKLKTHRKGGLTCALKNMIGINCIKDCLPHHTAGSKADNGDEYLHRNIVKTFYSFLEEFVYRKHVQHRLLLSAVSMARYMSRLIMKLHLKDRFFEGSWYGNDTIWRTVLDLNRILYYADKNGIMRESIQRTSFVLVDAIVAGEGEGPLEPTSKACGVLIAGLNPVAVDYVAAGIMGFDYKKIPQIARSFFLEEYPLVAVPADEIVIFDNGIQADYGGGLALSYNFRPTKGWEDSIMRL